MPEPSPQPDVSPLPVLSAEEEVELTGRFLGGDDEAFESLVGLHWNGLLRYATTVLGDPDLAEDLVQDQMSRALSDLDLALGSHLSESGPPPLPFPDVGAG